MFQFIVKRGFSGTGEKEYFAAEKDGDTIAGIVAGPFASREHTFMVIDALRPLGSGRPLVCVIGHLVSQQWTFPKEEPCSIG